MKELLNAEELNDLLTAVTEGQVPATPAAELAKRRTVQPYDFRRPARLSLDEHRALQRLHDGVAVAISSTLSGLLHTPVEASVIAIELATYGALNSALPNPVCLQVFRTRPGERRGLLTLDIPLAFSIIDRLLGGQGQALAQHKPLTTIEQAIITPLLHALLERFAAAWSVRSPLALGPEEIAMSPKAVQILAVQELVLQASFSVAGETCVGDLSLCVPFAVVRDLIPSADPEPASAKDAQGSQARQALQRALGAAPLRLSAELGRGHITVRDLLRLRPGHVVRLDSRVGRPLDITVEGDLHLAGQPGLVGARRGVQITQTPTIPKQGS
jgi:flagellar motor switch protein FliM